MKNRSKTILIMAIAAGVIVVLCFVALIDTVANRRGEQDDACQHIEAIDPSVAPTCTQSGLTEGTHCELCGAILTEQQSISKTEHRYVDGTCSTCGETQPIDTEELDWFLFTELADGTYSVKAKNVNSMPQTLVIPSTHQDKAVTVIENGAFQNCQTVTSITIPESVTQIGKSAFEGCTALTEIRYRATDCSAMEMANRSFYEAGKAGDGIKVIIGANVKKIPECLFYSKTSTYSSSPTSPKIVSVEFEEGSVCELIGSYAFFDCHYLISLKVPDSVKEIDHDAFSNCKNLVDLNLGNGVTILDNAAFMGCSSLKSLTIPAQVELIIYRAFHYCTSLTEIRFLATDCELWDNGRAFADIGQYSSGVTVVIGANVKNIPAHLFQFLPMDSGIPNIVSLRFEEGSVCESIGDSAFENCAYLKDIYYPSTVEQWALIDIGQNNLPIQNATMHYQGEAE